MFVLSRKYVVYRHINNKTGEVFYVGKGTYGGKQGYDRPYESRPYRRNSKWNEYVSDIQGDFKVEIIKEFDNESDAFKYELELQRYYWSINQAQCCILHSEEWYERNMKAREDANVSKKISEKLKGRPKSEDVKSKISNTLKGVYCRVNNPNKRKVKQYTLEGEFVREYESLQEGARAVNGCAGHIVNVCNGKCRQHKGYIWKYSEIKSIRKESK